MKDLYLGIDIGGTTTKAAVFDHEGRAVGRSQSVNQIIAGPGGKVERDMAEVWKTTAATIRACLDGIDVDRIAAMGNAGHSDGMYPITNDDRPASHAIQATDTRAAEQAAR